MTPSTTQLLSGIKVLDASRVLAGPFATMLLGDLGAEVIKVERPGVGDQTRAWGPPFVHGESAYYLSINRNKRSITLNLKEPKGKEIFRKLAADSDVVIENFQPGDFDRLGLGYETLKQINEKLIYCSITGYGENSSWKDRPAYDIALQAESGLMSITGDQDGEPVRVGVAVIDIVTGQYVVQAILAALLGRQRTGIGQKIDLSMLDCGVAFLTYMGQFYFATGTPPRGMGSRHPTIAPYQALPTQDSFVVIAVGSQEIWARFCEAIGRPTLTRDSRFSDNTHRVENREALERLLTAIFQQRTTAEWLGVLRRHEIPATPVNDLRAVFELEPVKERGMIQHVSHPAIGQLAMINSPLRFEETPVAIRRAPPLLGQHTEEILQELGYAHQEIAFFQEHGIV